jgi:AhpD family alkylhydroperoxidase
LASVIAELDNPVYYFVNHIDEFTGGIVFPEHTLESAPPESRRLMAATAKHLGHVPSAMARLAESPEMLSAFLKASGMFETTTLDPIAQEVVVLTIATRNGCHVCIAMHSERLAGLGADPELITALRDQKPLDDQRLEAIRTFTVQLLASAGAVSDAELDAFAAHGYTARNALEVVLGIGAYTMSTFANRLVRA